MKIVITFLIVLISQMEGRTFAQTNDYSVQTCENKVLREFLISVGEIQKASRASCYAIDLSKMIPVKNVDKCGIYKIGAFADHSFAHILLLDKEKKVFLDCHANLSQTLYSLFSFLDNGNCRFTDSEKLSYIKAILDIYNQNETAVPW